MPYPERLIPQINYKFINIDDLPDKSYVLRHTASQDIWDTLGKLKVDAALPFKRDIFGLSCNLLGIFTYDDIYLKVISKKLEADWKEDESPQEVNTSDFSLAPERGGFFLKLSSFHGKQFPFNRPVSNIESEFQSTASFHHKPILCNFWHFELHFKDNEEKFIDRNKRNNWIKNFAESLRKSILKKFALKEVSDSEILLPDIYTKPHIDDTEAEIKD